MKTLERITALSLVLVFAAVAAYSATIGKIEPNPPANPIVRHVVNVVLPFDRDMCGSYVVEVRNQKGNLVAPAKIFVQGITQYVFYEKSQFTQGETSRVALMRSVTSIGAGQCSEIYRAEPSVINAVFEPGKTYNYILYPQLQGLKQ
jgi:hypothetical protein